MAELIKNNQTALRSCILYEVLHGKSVHEAYKNLCKVMGKNQIEKKEFEFWFNRFANQKADLDGNCMESESLSFSDLPTEILGEIVGKLDLADRLRTRKVSRFLQTVVDKQNALVKSINIHTKPNQVDIRFDYRNTIHYKKTKNGCLIKREGKQFKEKFMKNCNYMGIVVHDLEIVLKRPNLKLKELRLTFDENSDAESKKVLDSFEYLKPPIHVESLRIENGGKNDILSFLSLLKPGTLENIHFGYRKQVTNTKELVGMEQWKQAKQVHFGRPVPIGYEEFLHLTHFNIPVESISGQDVIYLRDALSKSANFKSCHLRSHVNLDTDEIKRALGAEVVQHPFGFRLIIHPIPGSDEFLYFDISSRRVTIKRQQKVP